MSSGAKILKFLLFPKFCSVFLALMIPKVKKITKKYMISVPEIVVLRLSTKKGLVNDLTNPHLFDSLTKRLEYALSHHGFCHFHEASNVSALDVVNVTVGLSAVLNAVLVDVLHDPKELGINFFLGPRETL